MKALLDENLDHRLRKHLAPYEIFTVKYMGWVGFKNGNLIPVAEDAGFELLITGDQTLYNEQNWIGRHLAIVVLSNVEWRIMKDYLPQIRAAIDDALPGSFQSVDCGAFTRRDPS